MRVACNVNFLKDVLWVQQTHAKLSVRGWSNRWILNNHINVPGRRHISEQTFYRYLNIPAEKLLRGLGHQLEELKIDHQQG